MIARSEVKWQGMSMTIELLEREITDLKQRVEKLEAKAKPVAKSTWLEAFGAMKDDDVSREAARLGAEYRAQQNRRE